MPSSEKLILVHDNADPCYEIFDHGAYRIGYFIAKNSESQSHNEDVVFLKAEGDSLFFGVADGAGGHPRGQDAAFIVGDEAMSIDFKKSEIAVLGIIERINRNVIGLKAGARSTLAMGLLSSGDLRFYSVGDSEIVYWNSQGKEIYSNIPDSVVGHKIEAGLIDQSESLDNPDRNIVNSLIGDDVVRVEATSEMNMNKGQTVLVGTDGLFDNFSHEYLAEEVGKGEFRDSFNGLVQQCLARDPKTWKKDDDIAFIVIRRIAP